MKPILEIACFNYESALIAQKGGADRIELCEDFLSGGITPNIDLVKKLKMELSIPIFAMIRPRAGNFLYSEEEFQVMKRDILFFKNCGIDGFVFGILNDNNEIDKQRNKELVLIASPLPCTFHRAFDKVADAVKSLEILIDCGFSRVLTSGLQNSAMDGKVLLSELIELSGDRIIIIPGGGIRSDNLSIIKNTTHAKEFHSSAIIKDNIADLAEIKLLKEIIEK
jgi:copper homeostasis protein